MKLYKQAEYLELVESAELQALRGQFRFRQAFAKQGLDPSSLIWEPKLYSEETDSAWAVILLMRGMVPSRADHPSQDMLDVVREASSDLGEGSKEKKKVDLPLVSEIAKEEWAFGETLQSTLAELIASKLTNRRQEFCHGRGNRAQIENF